MAKKPKDLVKVIRDNPGCIAVVDNDCWWLYRDEAHRDEDDPEPIAQSGEVKSLGDGGYGSGHCYGGDILQALAKIVGIKVESV